MTVLPDRTEQKLSFGPFQLIAVDRLLLRDGKPVGLAPRVFDTLVVLASRHGHLVTKQELLDKVWHGAFVEDGSLCTAISSLRKALGEHRYVETVPKKGYRFIAPVETLQDGSELAIPQPPTPVVSDGVLDIGPAMAAVSNDHEQLSRSAGLSSRLGQLAVLALTIVLGISLAVYVASERRAHRTGESLDVRARQSYRTGRHFLSKRTAEGLKKAIEQFEQSTRADPLYARAYAGLASSYALLNLYSSLPSKHLYPLAKSAAAKALALDSSLAEAHAALGAVYLYYDWDWTAAEAAFKKAIECDPEDATAHHWLGLSLGARGRLEDSVKELNLALELDALSLISRSELARMLYLSGRPNEAIEASHKALDLDPFFMRAHIRLGEAFWIKGMLPQAIQALQRAVEMSDSDVPRATLGSAYAAAGDLATARRYLTELETRARNGPVSPYSFALLHAALGEPDSMFADLERAFTMRASALIYILVEPSFKRYHSDTHYRTLIRRMRLEPLAEELPSYAIIQTKAH